jgi:DeoR/GlpR family transcriptional regulator of sugar metabolism
MAYHYEVKRRIAKAAAELVEDEETVMIESGSCCALLAEELANTKRGITIVTNSAFIANHIRHTPYGKIILLGGEYQTDSQVMVGPVLRKYAEVFFSEKFFIGTDGFTEKYGFTGRDHLRAQAVRDMAEQAQQLIVLTESEKFFHQGIEGLVRTDDVSAVYTDTKIPSEVETFLMERDVLVHKVPSSISGFIPQETEEKELSIYHE